MESYYGNSLRAVYKEELGYTPHTGFYYDQQMQDPYMSISLHPNTKLDEGFDVWVKADGPYLDAMTPSKEWSNYYSCKPIARCILTEDFNFNITNNWTDCSMGNPIEDLFNSAKPYASILQKLGKGTKEGLDAVAKENMFGASLVGTYSNIMNGLGVSDFLQKSGKFLNNALMVQGTRLTYYNGTQYNFNNMEMKYIVFSDWTSEGEYQSVMEYLKKLKPYVQGRYKTIEGDLTGKQRVDEFIKEYCGWQEPPGGFEQDTRNIENILQGTLRLNVGSKYCFENLVIKNMNVVLSKTLAKHPLKQGETVPLFAEITLTLAPATVYIDKTYDKILNASTDGGLSSLNKKLTTNYNSKLNSMISTVKGNLNSYSDLK